MTEMPHLFHALPQSPPDDYPLPLPIAEVSKTIARESLAAEITPTPRP